jgi:hypothetical protein
MAVAYRSSSHAANEQNNNKTINVPSGTTTNDITIVIACTWWTSVAWQNNYWSVSGGNGSWNQCYSYSGADPGGGQQLIEIFWKRATSADTGTYSATLDATMSTWNEVAAVTFSGVDTGITDIFETSNRNTGTGVTAMPSVSVTTANSDPIILWHTWLYDYGAVTPPTNWTEAVDASESIAVA